MQEGGIRPDIAVPQISDPDYKSRPVFREADLRKHLVNEVKADNVILEEDTKPDPRFAATPDELKKRGVTDFQLYYALQTIGRLSRGARDGQALRQSVTQSRRKARALALLIPAALLARRAGGRS